MEKSKVKLKADELHLCGDTSKMTVEEIEMRKQLLEMDLKEEKSDSQKQLGYAAFIAIVVVMLLLFLPVIPDSRIVVLSELISTFFVMMASLVGAVMGFNSWMNKR